MTNEQPAWPNEHIALDAASRWVASTCACEVATPEILRIKRWGVTARFGSVVLKASFTPLFPQVTEVHAVLERIVPEGAPRLIASEMVDGQLWTLFEHLQGATAEEVGTPRALEATARELARVQAAVAKQDLTRLPVFDVRRVPGALLEDDLSDQPVELVQWLRDAQPATSPAWSPPGRLDRPGRTGGATRAGHRRPGPLPVRHHPSLFVSSMAKE